VPHMLLTLGGENGMEGATHEQAYSELLGCRFQP
jgi:hypothetical protein